VSCSATRMQRILAEAGGRRVTEIVISRYSDYTASRAHCVQPGSAMKPLVVPGRRSSRVWPRHFGARRPIGVLVESDDSIKWIANYDNQFKGPIPMRQALAESRNGPRRVDHA